MTVPATTAIIKPKVSVPARRAFHAGLDLRRQTNTELEDLAAAHSAIEAFASEVIEAAARRELARRSALRATG